MPGLAAGITAAGPDADFGLSTAPSPLRFLAAHQALARQLGFRVTVLARQVHGRRVLDLEGTAAGAEGAAAAGPAFHSPGEADGLVTGRRGVLLAVTAADCVPVFLAAPEAGLTGLLHAGWRGVAAGILEEGVRVVCGAGGLEPRDLLVHLGPGICGSCYEVGPEVPAALGLVEAASEEDGAAWRRGGTLRVDLRRALAARAAALGVPAAATSRSPWCTRCAADRFHSHRGRGSAAGRMAAFLGWREAPPG